LNIFKTALYKKQFWVQLQLAELYPKCNEEKVEWKP